MLRCIRLSARLFIAASGLRTAPLRGSRYTPCLWLRLMALILLLARRRVRTGPRRKTARDGSSRELNAFSRAVWRRRTVGTGSLFIGGRISSRIAAPNLPLTVTRFTGLPVRVTPPISILRTVGRTALLLPAAFRRRLGGVVPVPAGPSTLKLGSRASRLLGAPLRILQARPGLRLGRCGGDPRRAITSISRWIRCFSLPVRLALGCRGRKATLGRRARTG